MNNNQIQFESDEKRVVKLVPGAFSLCPYCDEINQMCRKFNIPRTGWGEIGEYTWQNYCLYNGGCDRFF